MKKFKGGWTVNDGESYNYNCSGDDPRELADQMRSICLRKTLCGYSSNWYVEDINGVIIYAGEVD